MEMAASLSPFHSSAPSLRLFLVNTPHRSSFKPKPFHSSPNFRLNRLFDRHLLLRCRSSKNEHDDTRRIPQGFSILESDAPWETGTVWSSMGLYLFSLHIPLSFGGLSAVAEFLHQADLAPETKIALPISSAVGIWTKAKWLILCVSNALSFTLFYGNRFWVTFLRVFHQHLTTQGFHRPHSPCLLDNAQALSVLAIQSLELFSTLLLLNFTSSRDYTLPELLKPAKSQNGRNWLLASLLGFMLLMLIIFVTSYLADNLVGTKDVNDPTLKQILSSGAVSQISCTLVYCLITPVLEELIYRRFFLTSLASAMNWRQAVFISSAVFSASHLSVENLVQLFVVGCVLGCTYCWTGDLRSSIALHSLYNALTLLLTFLA